MTRPSPTDDLAELRALADAGHGPAMVKLANRLWEGQGLPADPAAAEALLRRAADAAEPLAMLVLGQRLVFGMGLARDPASGEPWLQRAAETGFAPAMEALASWLARTGRAVEGAPWLARAAEAGEVGAMATLGANRWDAGERESGEAWLRHAGERGFGRADLLLGERLLATEPAEGRRLLERALARREPRAGLILGLLHYEAGDFAGAVSAFERALALGADGARINLAFMARRGEWPAGTPVPDVEALLAPLVARDDPNACLNLALWTLGRDPEAARALARRAAAGGADWGWWQTRAAAGDADAASGLALLARGGYAGSQ